MRRLRLSFLLRRMGSAWPLLACLTAAVFIAAALTAALASFDEQVLPDAITAQLDHAPGMYVSVFGQLDARGVATASKVVPGAIKSGFGQVRYQLARAVWSDSLGLPKQPGAGSAASIRLIDAAAIDGVRPQVYLQSGSWPGAPAAGKPVPAALPAGVAATLGVQPGQQLALTDRTTGKRVRLLITGTYRPRNPAARYWNVDQLPTSGVSYQGGFVSYGPAIVAPAAFGGPTGRVQGAALSIGGVSWVALPAAGTRYSPATASALESKVNAAIGRLRNSSLGLQVGTGMPQVLTATDRATTVARSLLVIGGLQLLLVVAAAVALVGRLLARDRDGETALLAARGAGRWQLVAPSAAEALLLGVLAVVAGALVGARLAGLLLSRGGARVAGAHLTVAAAGPWLAACVVLVLCTVIILWPALRPQAPGTARVSRGRQRAVSGIAAAGGDLALVALALLAIRELRTYSALSQSASGVDPALVVAPALALAGLSLLPLRLLPLLARLLERVTARGKRLPAALASWEISRRPLRQSGPALLVVLAVGAATLGFGQYESARQSAHDQAAYSAGADVRVGLGSPLALNQTGQVVSRPDVQVAMPVATAPYGQGNSEVLALNGRQAGRVVTMRPDLSTIPLGKLWHKLRTPGAGLAIPGQPARLQLTAAVRPGLGQRLGRFAVSVTIQDGEGVAYQLAAGTLPSDGRPHRLVVPLGGPGKTSYPLRLLNVSLSYPLPEPPVSPAAISANARAAAVTISSLAAAPAAGSFTRFAGGQALASWAAAGSSPSLADYAQNVLYFRPYSTPPASLGWQHGAGGSQVLEFSPSHQPKPTPLYPIAPGSMTGLLTITAQPADAVLPAIATSGFLRTNHTALGARFQVQVGGASVRVHVVAVIAGFPTTGAAGALIVDQSALQQQLAGQNQAALPITEWWLTTAGKKVPAGLPAHATVASLASLTSQLAGNPLSRAPLAAALAVAFAVAVLAALGFSVSVAASIRERRTQAAVLSALGVPKGTQARLLCLEEMMLSVPAAAAGLLVGVLLTHLVVPAITLTPAGQVPFPAVRVLLPLGWAAGIAVLIGAVPVVAAALTVIRRPDPAAQLRTAEAA